MTNNVALAAKTIADIYKSRWQIEIIFKWIKQNLNNKTFIGSSKNAVMRQIWITLCVYLILSELLKVYQLYGPIYSTDTQAATVEFIRPKRPYSVNPGSQWRPTCIQQPKPIVLTVKTVGQHCAILNSPVCVLFDIYRDDKLEITG